MKKRLIILITVSFLVANLTAQIPSPGGYLENKSMNPFHGNWLWTDGLDTVRFVLQTQKVYFPIEGGFYWDRLAGWHLYNKKGQTAENSLQYINTTDVLRYAVFMGGNENFYPKTCVIGILTDVSKKKTGDLQLDLDTTASPHRLSWKLENSEGIRIRRPGEPPFDVNFTLPRNMIFIKQ